MRGTTTAEVCLDEGNAASSSAAMRAIEQSDGSAANGGARDRIWLRRNLQGRRIRSNGVGNPGMSDETSAHCCNNPENVREDPI